jgi:hypothetical protein
MLGFCRWKQHRLREALALFHEQEAIMGDNEILCENIGHTYSSLGDFDAAVASFQKGLYLLGVNGDPGRKAGFYYGMALAKDRLGSCVFARCTHAQAQAHAHSPSSSTTSFWFVLFLRPSVRRSEESIPLLHAALDGYRQERVDPSGNPIDSSIHAKVQMSLGHMHEKVRARVYLHACACSCTPVRVLARLCVFLHACACSCTPVRVLARLCVFLHACACSCTPVRVLARLCVHLHACACTCTPVCALARVYLCFVRRAGQGQGRAM